MFKKNKLNLIQKLHAQFDFKCIFLYLKKSIASLLHDKRKNV